MVELRKHWISYFGFLLAFLLFSVRLNEQNADRLYTNTVFQWVRTFFDSWLRFVQFPVLYVFAGFLCIIIFSLFYSKNKSGKSSAIRSLGFLSWTFVSFYFLWGLNYSNSKIKDRLSLDPVSIDSLYLVTEVFQTIDSLNDIRSKLSLDTNELVLDFDPVELNELVRPYIEDILVKSSYPVSGNPIIKALNPKGILLRISTAGFYFPFGGEGYIDKGLHTIQWPSTIAHELSHGYGVTDEGECNFIAIIACLESDDYRIKYSGQIMYFQYLLSAIRTNPDLVNSAKSKLERPVVKDFTAIYRELDKYPDIFPGIRNLIYDRYLKSNGIKEGVKSYGTVVELMAAYKLQLKEATEMHR